MLSGSPCATEALTILELDNCPLLSDTTLNHLINCHNLQRIELYDCQLITRAGIQRLKVRVTFQLPLWKNVLTVVDQNIKKSVYNAVEFLCVEGFDFVGCY